MTSFGRLTAAVFAGVVESTQALANVNFDFSLIKVEAPQEFHGVGHALTAHRRAEAEDGSIHITARRLGAIFESLLPPTPNLLKAYGLRASEIGKSCAADSRKEPGMFAEQIGIDATTIWAAATSGSGAIQAHLLACMLARIWDGPEAISIWVELLECRRTEVRNKFEETGSVDMSTLMAVRQQLSRAQLAEWDASARAWLRIADNAKALQQKQLLLIIGNLTTLVNAKPHFYQNVVESWKAGLEGMERLLQGSPLQMQSGELLLGLSAWHLYPDLMVLDPATHLVRQRDPLVPDSGILTLGLEMSDISHSKGLKSKGLHWSLPLAHLRYYGDPVRCSAVISAQGSRLSIYEFHQAVLGCLLGGWNVMDSEIEAVIHWVSHLSTLFNEAVTSVSYGAVTSTSHNAIFSWHKHKGSWLSLLGRTARSFLDSVAVERRKNTQLVNLGRRHASFLGKPALPYFGLLEIERVIKLAKGQETKIQLLRALAASCQVSKRSLIIRYVSDETGREEFATAVPCDREPLKRTASQSSKKSSGHLRWVHSKPVYYADKEFDESVPFKDVYFGYVEPGDTTSEPKPPVSTVDRITQVRADFNAQKAKYEAAGEQTLAVEDEPLKIVERMNEKIRVVWGEVEQNSGLSDFDPWFGEVKHYELCLGDPSSAGLFARMKHHRPELPKQMPINQLQLLFRNRMLDFDLFPELLCQSLMSLGRDHLLSLKAIALMDKAYMEATHSTVDVRVLQSPLDSVSWTQDIDEQRFDIYDEERELPYARPTAKVNNKGTESEASDNTPTVSDREGEARLQDHDQDDDSRGHDEDVSDNEDAGGPTSPGYFNDAIGSPPQQGASPQRTAISSNFLRHCILEVFVLQRLTIKGAFSCILFFESRFNVAPKQLENVMAISSGNTLFIAAHFSVILPPYHLVLRYGTSWVTLGDQGQCCSYHLWPPESGALTSNSGICSI